MGRSAALFSTLASPHRPHLCSVFCLLSYRPHQLRKSPGDTGENRRETSPSGREWPRRQAGALGPGWASGGAAVAEGTARLDSEEWIRMAIKAQGSPPTEGCTVNTRACQWQDASCSNTPCPGWSGQRSEPGSERCPNVPCCSSVFVGLAAPTVLELAASQGTQNYHALVSPGPAAVVAGPEPRWYQPQPQTTGTNHLPVTVTKISSKVFNIKLYYNERLKPSPIGQRVLGRFQG